MNSMNLNNKENIASQEQVFGSASKRAATSAPSSAQNFRYQLLLQIQKQRLEEQLRRAKELQKQAHQDVEVAKKDTKQEEPSSKIIQPKYSQNLSKETIAPISTRIPSLLTSKSEPDNKFSSISARLGQLRESISMNSSGIRQSSILSNQSSDIKSEIKTSSLIQNNSNIRSSVQDQPQQENLKEIITTSIKKEQQDSIIMEEKSTLKPQQKGQECNIEIETNTKDLLSQKINLPLINSNRVFEQTLNQNSDISLNENKTQQFYKTKDVENKISQLIQSQIKESKENQEQNKFISTLNQNSSFLNSSILSKYSNLSSSSRILTPSLLAESKDTNVSSSLITTQSNLRSVNIQSNQIISQQEDFDIKQTNQLNSTLPQKSSQSEIKEFVKSPNKAPNETLKITNDLQSSNSDSLQNNQYIETQKQIKQQEELQYIINQKQSKISEENNITIQGNQSDLEKQVNVTKDFVQENTNMDNVQMISEQFDLIIQQEDKMEIEEDPQLDTDKSQDQQQIQDQTKINQENIQNQQIQQGIQIPRSSELKEQSINEQENQQILETAIKQNNDENKTIQNNDQQILVQETSAQDNLKNDLINSQLNISTRQIENLQQISNQNQLNVEIQLIALLSPEIKKDKSIQNEEDQIQKKTKDLDQIQLNLTLLDQNIQKEYNQQLQNQNNLLPIINEENQLNEDQNVNDHNTNGQMNIENENTQLNNKNQQNINQNHIQIQSLSDINNESFQQIQLNRSLSQEQNNIPQVKITHDSEEQEISLILNLSQSIINSNDKQNLEQQNMIEQEQFKISEQNQSNPIKNGQQNIQDLDQNVQENQKTISILIQQKQEQNLNIQDQKQIQSAQQQQNNNENFLDKKNIEKISQILVQFEKMEGEEEVKKQNQINLGPLEQNNEKSQICNNIQENHLILKENELNDHQLIINDIDKLSNKTNQVENDGLSQTQQEKKSIQIERNSNKSNVKKDHSLDVVDQIEECEQIQEENIKSSEIKQNLYFESNQNQNQEEIKQIELNQNKDIDSIIQIQENYKDQELSEIENKEYQDDQQTQENEDCKIQNKQCNYENQPKQEVMNAYEITNTFNQNMNLSIQNQNIDVLLIQKVLNNKVDDNFSSSEVISKETPQIGQKQVNEREEHIETYSNQSNSIDFNQKQLQEKYLIQMSTENKVKQQQQEDKIIEETIIDQHQSNIQQTTNQTKEIQDSLIINNNIQQAQESEENKIIEEEKIEQNNSNIIQSTNEVILIQYPIIQNNNICQNLEIKEPQDLQNNQIQEEVVSHQQHQIEIKKEIYIKTKQDFECEQQFTQTILETQDKEYLIDQEQQKVNIQKQNNLTTQQEILSEKFEISEVQNKNQQIIQENEQENSSNQQKQDIDFDNSLQYDVEKYNEQEKDSEQKIQQRDIQQYKHSINENSLIQDVQNVQLNNGSMEQLHHQPIQKTEIQEQLELHQIQQSIHTVDTIKNIEGKNQDQDCMDIEKEETKSLQQNNDEDNTQNNNNQNQILLTQQDQNIQEESQTKNESKCSKYYEINNNQQILSQNEIEEEPSFKDSSDIIQKNNQQTQNIESNNIQNQLQLLEENKQIVTIELLNNNISTTQEQEQQKHNNEQQNEQSQENLNQYDNQNIEETKNIFKTLNNFDNEIQNKDLQKISNTNLELETKNDFYDQDVQNNSQQITEPFSVKLNDQKLFHEDQDNKINLTQQEKSRVLVNDKIDLNNNILSQMDQFLSEKSLNNSTLAKRQNNDNTSLFKNISDEKINLNQDTFEKVKCEQKSLQSNLNSDQNNSLSYTNLFTPSNVRIISECGENQTQFSNESFGITPKKINFQLSNKQTENTIDQENKISNTNPNIKKLEQETKENYDQNGEYPFDKNSNSNQDNNFGNNKTNITELKTRNPFNNSVIQNVISHRSNILKSPVLSAQNNKNSINTNVRDTSDSRSPGKGVQNEAKQLSPTEKVKVKSPIRNKSNIQSVIRDDISISSLNMSRFDLEQCEVEKQNQQLSEEKQKKSISIPEDLTKIAKTLGITKHNRNQNQIIDAIYNKNQNICKFMLNSSGKNILYQTLALLDDTLPNHFIIVVTTQFITLRQKMNKQVSWGCINSLMGVDTLVQVQNLLMEKKIKLLFVQQECLLQEQLRFMKDQVKLIIYEDQTDKIQEINEIYNIERYQLFNTTGFKTLDQVNHVCDKLSLKNFDENINLYGFDFSNIHWTFESDKEKSFINFIRKNNLKKVIMFIDKSKKIDEVVSSFNQKGLKMQAFNQQKVDQIHQQFIKDQFEILCCYNGQFIPKQIKQIVQYYIHYHIPRSVVSYLNDMNGFQYYHINKGVLYEKFACGFLTELDFFEIRSAMVQDLTEKKMIQTVIKTLNNNGTDGDQSSSKKKPAASQQYGMSDDFFFNVVLDETEIKIQEHYNKLIQDDCSQIDGMETETNVKQIQIAKFVNENCIKREALIKILSYISADTVQIMPYSGQIKIIQKNLLGGNKIINAILKNNQNKTNITFSIIDIASELQMTSQELNRSLKKLNAEKKIQYEVKEEIALLSIKPNVEQIFDKLFEEIKFQEEKQINDLDCMYLCAKLTCNLTLEQVFKYQKYKDMNKNPNQSEEGVISLKVLLEKYLNEVKGSEMCEIFSSGDKSKLPFISLKSQREKSNLLKDIQNLVPRITKSKLNLLEFQLNRDLDLMDFVSQSRFVSLILQGIDGKNINEFKPALQFKKYFKYDYFDLLQISFEYLQTYYTQLLQSETTKKIKI